MAEDGSQNLDESELLNPTLDQMEFHLRHWMREIFPDVYVNTRSDNYEKENGDCWRIDKDDEALVRCLRFAVGHYEFRLSFNAPRKIDPKEPRYGYFGPSVKSLKIRPGEDWQRGNDLPDGQFRKESWDRFLKSVIQFSLRKMEPPRREENALENFEVPEGAAEHWQEAVEEEPEE